MKTNSWNILLVCLLICAISVICGLPGCGPTVIAPIDANRIVINVQLVVQPEAVAKGAIQLNIPIAIHFDSNSITVNAPVNAPVNVQMDNHLFKTMPRPASQPASRPNEEEYQ